MGKALNHSVEFAARELLPRLHLHKFSARIFYSSFKNTCQLMSFFFFLFQEILSTILATFRYYFLQTALANVRIKHLIPLQPF